MPLCDSFAPTVSGHLERSEKFATDINNIRTSETDPAASLSLFYLKTKIIIFARYRSAGYRESEDLFFRIYATIYLLSYRFLRAVLLFFLHSLNSKSKYIFPISQIICSFSNL